MAGAKLKDGDTVLISDVPVTSKPVDEAAYGAILVASTVINNALSSPDMGFTSAVANHDYLSDDFSSPDAGIKTGSSSAITYGFDTSAAPDAGQALLQTAASNQERRVITILRLDGSATAAWCLVSDDTRTGGSVGTHNERTSTVTVAAEPVDYTPV